MVDHGIKPAYVFDGKPPELKGGVVSTFFNILFPDYALRSYRVARQAICSSWCRSGSRGGSEGDW